MAPIAAGVRMMVAAACLAGAQVAPEHLALARIKLRMSENLERLPNYTCTETIERSTRRAGSRRFQLLDTMRLEVALVEGLELFAWPGAGRFEDREIKDFAPSGGAIGNGNFALHARAVFLGRAPVFQFAGEENLNGRAMLRYDFKVAQVLSGFEVRVGATAAVVGYHGSFWADPRTDEVARLELRASDIPPNLDLKEVSDTMDYSRLRIGESDFLLPTASEMTMIDMRGNLNRNRIQFSGCRQYAGRSLVTFEEPPPAPDAPEPAPRAIELPADLPLTVELTATIESGRSAIGDRLAGVVQRDARWKGRLVVPKGALLSGRLAHLERRTVATGRGEATYFVVGIEFDTLEFASGRAEFLGRLDEIGAVAMPVVRSGLTRPELVGREWSSLARPGVGLFVVKGDTIKLGPGFRMSWRVIEKPRR
ncbi:MAG: hypothetical protein Q8N47_20620 [Bryobacterales bacterium]|nr:hypothetical protein [Bryobacterales bacterium]